MVFFPQYFISSWCKFQLDGDIRGGSSQTRKLWHPVELTMWISKSSHASTRLAVTAWSDFQREQKISAYQIQCPDKSAQQKFSVQPGALAAFKGDWYVMVIKFVVQPSVSCEPSGFCWLKCPPFKSVRWIQKHAARLFFVFFSATSEGHYTYMDCMAIQVSNVCTDNSAKHGEFMRVTVGWTTRTLL